MTAPPTTGRGRRWRRLPVAVGGAAAVVVGAFGGYLWSSGDEGEGRPASPLPVIVAQAADWLDAWEADDRKAMAALAGARGEEEAALLASVKAFRVDLGQPTISVEPDLPTVRGDRATVPFDASVELIGLGVWQYRGELTLVRAGSDEDGDDGAGGRRDDGGRWRVLWSPSALHPMLTTPSHRLDLAVTWPARADLVLGDGQPAAGRVASALLGRVAPATAEQAGALGPLYRAGQAIGVSGLQASQQRVLAGTPSAEVRLLDGDTAIASLLRFEGSNPTPVRVTIDPRVTTIGQEALEAAGEGKLAALVAIRPSTGDVVAAVSRPSGGFDRALLGRYPPGSTFKVVTTLALLTKGVRPDETVSCPGEVVIGGRRFVNAEGHALGDIPFRRAFFESCNTAFVQLAQRLSPAELLAAAELLGFNRDPALGVPATTSSVPLPTGAVDLAASSIGQGRILATPLQMASVAASVAAGGYRPPRLVDTGPPPPVVALPAGVAETAAELMRLAVSSGTGTAARLPGAPVAGKTGTAEYGTEVPPRTHAWFIAFRGDVAVAVLVDDGGFGGQVAAPIAAAFLRRLGG